MKRIFSYLICTICILLQMTACAKIAKPPVSADFLDFGEKYLLEMNYEQAIVQFTKVIEIEPMNARGYTGLAEAYIAVDQIDMAKRVLEQGLSLLGEDESIATMLAEIIKAEEVAREAVRKQEEEDRRAALETEQIAAAYVAYDKFLRENEREARLTERYWWKYNDDATRDTVCIIDVCGDSTPELCWFVIDEESLSRNMSYDDYDIAHFRIYSYQEGELKLLLSLQSSKAGVWNNFFLASDGALYCHNEGGQSDISSELEKYLLNDGLLTPLEATILSTEASYPEHYYISDKGNIESEGVHWENQREISKDDYASRIDHIIQNASEALFIENYDGVRYRSVFNYNDPSIQYMPETAPVAMNYDEALTFLALKIDPTSSPAPGWKPTQNPSRSEAEAIAEQVARELGYTYEFIVDSGRDMQERDGEAYYTVSLLYYDGIGQHAEIELYIFVGSQSGKVYFNDTYPNLRDALIFKAYTRPF